MNRIEILEKALSLTSGDRNKSYGSPEPNLRTFAHLVHVYLMGKNEADRKNKKLDAVDGSVIMALAKISRIAVNKFHDDNYVDGAAYLAIAGECADVINPNQCAPEVRISDADKEHKSNSPGSALTREERLTGMLEEACHRLDLLNNYAPGTHLKQYFPASVPPETGEYFREIRS